MHYRIAVDEFKKFKDKLFRATISPTFHTNLNGHQHLFDEAKGLISNFYIGVNLEAGFSFKSSVDRAAKNGNENYKIDALGKVIDVIINDIELKEKLSKNEIKNSVKDSDIVHSDIHGEYNLAQLIKEYDSVVRTNINQGSKQSEISHLFENEKQKNQELQRQLDENKKSISYWFIISLVIVFFSYVNLTAHLLLEVKFNLVISFVAEVLVLGIISIFFFKEKAERRSIIGSIISTVIAAAIFFLAGIIAKNYGLI